MGYKLTRAEMETVIRWDGESVYAYIYTSDPVTMRKLDKLAQEYPDTYWTTATNGDSKSYAVNRKYIRFGKPVSDETRAKRRLNALKNGNKPPKNA